MILLFGIADDPILEDIAAALDRLGAPTLLIDQRRPPPELALDDNGGGRVGQTAIADIKAVYLRPADLRLVARAQGWGPGSRALAEAARFTSDFLALTEFAPWRVVNRLSTQASNTSKPWQLEHIRRWFDIPRTLVTTDPAEALAFVQACDAAIVKSVSGVRSVVRRVSASRLENIDAVGHCPTLFQEFVDGDDVRVHVVGDQVHATCIASTLDDYRYDRAARRHPYQLSDEVAERCVALSHSLGLFVSGIDLRQRPDGSWVCFEVNPSPGFVYFEPPDGHPIADAIASLMSQGTDRPSGGDGLDSVFGGALGDRLLPCDV
jgi:hypothetical protein